MRRMVALRHANPVALLAGLACVAPLLLVACEAAQEEVPLTGVSAFTLMRKDRQRSPETDVASVLSLIESQAARAKSKEARPEDIEPPAPVSNMMRKDTKAKLRLEPKTRFSLSLDVGKAPAQPDAAKPLGKGEVNLAGLDAEYMIPRVGNIPIRNQGERGTCAAFAGIGHLEYAALKAYSGLRTLDLSEQRFYYMSRPDCWSDGCQTDVEGGSWYGDGYEASKEEPLTGDNIPLEADCPYNPRGGANELQVRQRASCADNGAIKISATRMITEPQQIVDALENDKLPVLWASPLSDNWFENNGLVTAAAAGDPGDIMHAGGHAYLIVGYRLLPAMPEEGGMCFIVKNSWGTGWGANGYTCQTLKWMQVWRFRDESNRPVWLEHPVITGLTLRDDLSGGSLPDNDDAEDESAPDVPDEELDDGDGDGKVPDVLPDPEPDNLSWSALPLYGPGDSYYEAQVSRGGNGAAVRVALKGDTSFSNALLLEADPSDSAVLLYDGDQVGEFRDAEQDLLLCTDKYSMICSLRLDPNTNKLYIEFPYPYNRNIVDGEIPDGDWLSLLTEGVLGYDLQFQNPEDSTWFLENPKAFVRMERPDGTRTTPARMTRNEEGELRVMGASVGSITDLELCSGAYDEACRFLSAQDKLLVLPHW